MQLPKATRWRSVGRHDRRYGQHPAARTALDYDLPFEVVPPPACEHLATSERLLPFPNALEAEVLEPPPFFTAGTSKTFCISGFTVRPRASCG